MASRAILELMPLDPRSFDTFFSDSYARLCLFIYRIVGSDLVVEDIATDAFVVVWERRDTILDLLSAQKLLYRVARNAALNYVRAERSHDQLLAREVTEDARPPGGGRGTATDPHRSVEEADLETAVRAAIAALPSMRRQVYSLRWEQGWSSAEIAAALDLSIKTVEMHVSLAHKTLRAVLASYRP